MIPVRFLGRGQLPDLSSMMIAEVDQVDRGLTVVATSVPLAEDLVVEILAEDLDGKVVLVLVENGPSEPLFERTARALLEYRRTAPLLARIYPNGSFDCRETPRVILAAGRFSDELQGRLSLLRIPQLTLLEGVVSKGASGFHLVVTGLDRRLSVPAGSAASTRSDHGLRSPPAGNGTRPADTRIGRAAPPADDQPAVSLFHEPGEATEPVELVEPVASTNAGGSTHSSGAGRRASLVDSLKQRLLRLSPDVIEEEDGNLLYFRVTGHLLATVSKERDRLLVTPGGEQAAQIQVRDDVGLSLAMDAVFERFFGMSPTRRRIAAADRRVVRNAPGRQQSESESGAAGA